MTTKFEQDLMAEAIVKLRKFCNPNDEGCAVDPKVREAARLYLETWVLEPMVMAQSIATGSMTVSRAKFRRGYTGFDLG
jgi:hypothetical protein